LDRVSQTKILTFAGIMAALSNILSIEPLAIPIIIEPFMSIIHFSQVSIVIWSVHAGPWAGLLTWGYSVLGFPVAY